MAANADTDSLTWGTWLPNGFAREMADACKEAADVLAWIAWVLRWFIAASIVIPFAFWAFADSHSAVLAARGMLGGGAFAVLLGVLFFFAVILTQLFPREYRVDRHGISISYSKRDRSRAKIIAWSEIVAISVARPAGRVAYLKVQTTKSSRRIWVPNSNRLDEFTALVERMYGRPLTPAS